VKSIFGVDAYAMKDDFLTVELLGVRLCVDNATYAVRTIRFELAHMSLDVNKSLETINRLIGIEQTSQCKSVRVSAMIGYECSTKILRGITCFLKKRPSVTCIEYNAEVPEMAEWITENSKPGVLPHINSVVLFVLLKNDYLPRVLNYDVRCVGASTEDRCLEEIKVITVAGVQLFDRGYTKRNSAAWTCPRWALDMFPHAVEFKGLGPIDASNIAEFPYRHIRVSGDWSGFYPGLQFHPVTISAGPGDAYMRRRRKTERKENALKVLAVTAAALRATKVSPLGYSLVRLLYSVVMFEDCEAKTFRHRDIPGVSAYANQVERELGFGLLCDAQHANSLANNEQYKTWQKQGEDRSQIMLSRLLETRYAKAVVAEEAPVAMVADSDPPAKEAAAPPPRSARKRRTPAYLDQYDMSVDD
jgi:hypothetical protein